MKDNEQYRVVNSCVCTDQCAQLSTPESIPRRCPGLLHSEIIVRSRSECCREDSTARSNWQAFSRLVGHGAASRSRLEHIMEFANSMGWMRIGLAGCARYLELMHVTTRVLSEFGFKSICVSCKVGGNKFADIQIKKDSNWTLCNPVGQAMLLNDWDADLNVALGLCMGHDLLFQHYSNVPVTTLVVKEKISNDSPTSTLSRIAQGEYSACPYLPGSVNEDTMEGK